MATFVEDNIGLFSLNDGPKKTRCCNCWQTMNKTARITVILISVISLAIICVLIGVAITQKSSQSTVFIIIFIVEWLTFNF